MTAIQDLPNEGEETGREVIPSEGEGDIQVHQSFKEPLFGWPWVLEDWWVTPPHCLGNIPIYVSISI